MDRNYTTAGSAPAASPGWWATGGRRTGAACRRARRPDTAAGAGRPARAADPPAGRAELAAALGISRTTVATVYDALRGRASCCAAGAARAAGPQLPPELAGSGRVSPFFPHGKRRRTAGPGPCRAARGRRSALRPGAAAEAVGDLDVLPGRARLRDARAAGAAGRPSPIGSPPAACRPMTEPDPGHRRCPARDHAGPRRADRAGRPGAGGAPDLPQRAARPDQPGASARFRYR